MIECERALWRALHREVISEADASRRRATFLAAAAHWTVLPLQVEIANRARQPFPHEPVRTLDAVHLATLVVARALVPGPSVASLDDRIRRNARDLGFEVVPE